MSQFYSMLAHHRIGISSFSTDQCVLRELPKLQALEKKLLEAGFSVQRWTMIQDLRNIMRRLPANRKRIDFPFWKLIKPLTQTNKKMGG